MPLILVPAPFAFAQNTSTPSPSSEQLNQIVATARALNDGMLVRPDYARARQLFEQASQHGSLEAKAWLGFMAMNGRGTSVDLAAAKQLIEASAAGNNPVGLRFLGVLNQEGRAIPRNIEAAISNYEKARAAGDGNSCGRLGMIYIGGTATKRNFHKGRDLLMEGASLGDVWSQVELGQLYATLSSPRLDKTKPLYQTAAAQGSRLAAYRLGQIYQASGTPSDLTLAMSYYHQAAAKRMAPAAVALGQMYESGIGTSINLPRAYGLYKLAATRNDANGQSHLRLLAPRLTADERRRGDEFGALIESGNSGAD